MVILLPIGSVKERTSLMSIYRIHKVLSHTTVHVVEGKHERHLVLQLIPLQCDEHVHMLRKCSQINISHAKKRLTNVKYVHIAR